MATDGGNAGRMPHSMPDHGNRLDLALLERLGELVAHNPDCPDVHRARELELPIYTLIDCERIPTGLPIAPCLKEKTRG